MLGGMGREDAHWLDDNKDPSREGMVSTRGLGKKAQLGEQMDQAKPIVRIPVECYSRVVGYLRPVESWNIGRKQEFEERKLYKPGLEEDDEQLRSAGEVPTGDTGQTPD